MFVDVACLLLFASRCCVLFAVVGVLVMLQVVGRCLLSFCGAV